MRKWSLRIAAYGRYGAAGSSFLFHVGGWDCGGSASGRCGSPAYVYATHDACKLCVECWFAYTERRREGYFRQNPQLR